MNSTDYLLQLQNWKLYNLFKAMLKKYPNKEDWTQDKFNEVLKEIKLKNITFADFEGYVKTVFDKNQEDTTHNIGEPLITEQVEYSDDDVEKYYRNFINWLAKTSQIRSNILQCITAQRIGEYLNQYTLRDNTKNKLLSKISLRALSYNPKEENFSYLYRNTPLDNITESDLVNGELSFRKVIKGLDLTDDEKWQYRNLLDYMAKVNPNYSPMTLSDNELYILQRKVDSYRKLTPKDKSEIDVFSSHEDNGNQYSLSPFGVH